MHYLAFKLRSLMLSIRSIHAINNISVSKTSLKEPQNEDRSISRFYFHPDGTLVLLYSTVYYLPQAGDATDMNCAVS
jgi:hypothetical protein